MNSKQLNRVLTLIRETGDRFVVADSGSDEVFALMTLDDYEFLAGHVDRGIDEPFGDFDDSKDIEDNWLKQNTGRLSEQELLEKINNDIAQWRQEQKTEKEADSEIKDEEEMAEVSQESVSGMTPLGDVLRDEKYINGDFDEAERSHPNLGPVEDLGDVPEDRQEEEKFYLEPVE